MHTFSPSSGGNFGLEGSVRKAGNRVRITAQLVDATSGAELWAERYDRPLKDVFAVQDEIARRIVTTTNLQLTLLKQGYPVPKRTDNLEAYDYYLRGDEFFITSIAARSKKDMAKAGEMFEKAIELDPQYSDAYAMLGWVRFTQTFLQWTDPRGFAQAIQLYQRSIALDNFNSFAYAGLSGVYDFTRQYDLSLAAAQRAIAIDLNFAMGYSALAFVLCDVGRPAEAIPLAQKAARLDPLRDYYYAFFEGRAYAKMGRYADAIPLLKRNLDSPDGGVPALLYLILCYVETGRSDEGRAAAAEIMRINPQFSLAAQKQMSPSQQAWRDRLYSDLAKAGLK
jgi:adenylate cyclase